MSNKHKERTEEIKSHARDLAARIRFLREEIREGRVEGRAELEAKINELGSLFSVEPTIARIDFQIVDLLETPENNMRGIGSNLCLRIVQINNPKRASNSNAIKTVSLLRKDQSPENLRFAPPSEILPPAYGGI